MTHRIGVGAVLLGTFMAAVHSANIYIKRERERGVEKMYETSWRMLRWT